MINDDYSSLHLIIYLAFALLYSILSAFTGQFQAATLHWGRLLSGKISAEDAEHSALKMELLGQSVRDSGFQNALTTHAHKLRQSLSIFLFLALCVVGLFLFEYYILTLIMISVIGLRIIIKSIYPKPDSEYFKYIIINELRQQSYLCEQSHNMLQKEATDHFIDKIVTYGDSVAFTPPLVSIPPEFNEQNPSPSVDTAKLKDVINSIKANTLIDSGVAKAQSKHYESAIIDFTNAIHIEHSETKTYFNAYFNRANAKSQCGDFAGAIADYTKSIDLNAKQEEAYLYRGLAKLRFNDIKGGIEDFNKALEINPKDAILYYYRGMTFIECLNQKDIGMRDLLKARELGYAGANEEIKKYSM